MATGTSSFFLIRRISYNSIKCHFFTLSIPIARFENLINKLLLLVLHGVDQIIKIMSIDRNFSKTNEGSLCNTLCHWRFAYNKNIFLNRFRPQFVLFLYRQFFLSKRYTSCTENTIYHIKRIKPCLGVDFKNMCILIAECIRSYLSMVYKAWFFQHRCIHWRIFCVKTISSKAITHMHIDDTPRCQYSFFIRILKAGEKKGNLLYSFGWCKFIRPNDRISDSSSCCYKNILIIIFHKLLEYIFCHTTWHKFIPRCLIHDFVIQEHINRKIFINRNICTIDQKRHTN